MNIPLKDYPLKVFSGAEIELSKFIQQLLVAQSPYNKDSLYVHKSQIGWIVSKLTSTRLLDLLTRKYACSTISSKSFTESYSHIIFF